MKELVGKTIAAVYVGDIPYNTHFGVEAYKDGRLAFQTDAGLLSYDTWGDCCSESWFADITGVDALIGGIVTACDVAPFDGTEIYDGRTRQECDTVYGWILTTNKGRATIAFRNSSNGYYGGACERSNDDVDLSAMRQIVEDWSA